MCRSAAIPDCSQLTFAKVDTNMTVNQASIYALYLIVKQASDEAVLQVVDMMGRLGPLANLAAAWMQARDFDY